MLYNWSNHIGGVEVEFGNCDYFIASHDDVQRQRAEQSEVLKSHVTILLQFSYHLDSFASPALAAISICLGGVAKESNDMKIVIRV